MRIEVVYSLDDGGWYAEVVDATTGRTLHTTAVLGSKRLARAAASKWIEDQLPTRQA